MVASTDDEPVPAGNRTTSERRSDRELVVTRTFVDPARLVYEAWTTPALFAQWWLPASSGAALRSCEQDVRVGGRYRLELSHPQAPTPLAFFGRYLEVVPSTRLVWTNEESDDGAVTTVTFDEQDGRTLLTMTERYPSKEATDRAFDGMCEAMPETFAQLDAFLSGRRAGAN